MTDFQKISSAIRTELQKSPGGGHFAVYPFGDLGVLTKRILEEQYNFKVEYIFDDNISKYNSKIKPASCINELNNDDNREIILILATADRAVHDELRNNALKYISEKRILDIWKDDLERGGLWNPSNWERTICGKHSYGPLCNHPFVGRVGNYCSFAGGTNVVANHPTNLLSTSPFMSANGYEKVEGFKVVKYEAWKDEAWYIPGITPRWFDQKAHRITIGNDVWLGFNVTITNYSNIGDGVIAAAGSIITRDVPDYAIVAGVPARIIRFRYNPQQIQALKRIKWWNWEDWLVQERFDDLYLPIDEFIEKYDRGTLHE